jgi:hypothetical protein
MIEAIFPSCYFFDPISYLTRDGFPANDPTVSCIFPSAACQSCDPAALFGNHNHRSPAEVSNMTLCSRIEAPIRPVKRIHHRQESQSGIWPALDGEGVRRSTPQMRRCLIYLYLRTAKHVLAMQSRSMELLRTSESEVVETSRLTFLVDVVVQHVSQESLAAAIYAYAGTRRSLGTVLPCEF